MDVTLKSAPRPDAKEIGKVPMGTLVEAIEKQDFWVKVKDKVIFTHTYTFASDPMRAPGGTGLNLSNNQSFGLS